MPQEKLCSYFHLFVPKMGTNEFMISQLLEIEDEELKPASQFNFLVDFFFFKG